jgi:hypothetical protein
VKTLYLTFTAVATVISHFTSNVIVTIGGIIDAVICNVLNDIKNCFTYKLCIISFYDNSYPITILGVTHYIYIPLRTTFCRNLLGANPNVCPNVCDVCEIQPFGIPFNPDPWYIPANQKRFGGANDFAPYMYVPCNLAGVCCNYATSIFQKAL